MRIVVPDAPGGGGDILARIVQSQWGLSQPAVVENRSGAGGRIALENVWRSPPDGSTLLLGNAGTNGISAVTQRGLPYDIETGFAFISLIATGPNVLCTNPRVVPAHDIRALVALLRTAPGRYNYGSSGAGTSGHFSMELFKLQTRLEVEHIPYRGVTAAVQAAITGDAPLLMGNLSSATPFIQRNELLPVAVTSLERARDLPDVPTLHETVLPGFDTIAWNGMFGPPGLPGEIVRAANAEMTRIAALPETAERVRAQGVEIIAGGPEALAGRVHSDIAKWKDLVARTGISID